ncbi:MAG: hypothetical protein LBH19_10795 [Dysgonamonadaceae bacterium]|jgi:hypothetical protein|nr:hypothetical protein [Dysgonamonadaceae bacterium]
MAKQTNNVVTHGLHGKIGDLLVFRQVNGKTIIAKMPQPSKKSSEKQQTQRKHFQEAIIYAKTAMADPAAKEAYRSSAPKGLTAYNMAVADMLHAPSIENVDLSNYSGHAGDTIRIIIKDDFLVKEAKVTIINADGSPVEEGDATPDGSGLVWTFTATQDNENTAGDKIIITASDLPGNATQEEQVL